MRINMFKNTYNTIAMSGSMALIEKYMMESVKTIIMVYHFLLTVVYRYSKKIVLMDMMY